MHPIVKQIIDRDCHVGISNRAVMRHVISRLKCGWATFRQMPKADHKKTPSAVRRASPTKPRGIHRRDVSQLQAYRRERMIWQRCEFTPRRNDYGS